jgi:hypothetical protein
MQSAPERVRSRRTGGRFRDFLQAGEGVRTLDIQLGKLALYQLSYTRAKPTVLPRSDANVKEPQIGIEPMTARLRIECSTTELLWRDRALGRGAVKSQQPKR